jgi:hypothetical protein
MTYQLLCDIGNILFKFGVIILLLIIVGRRNEKNQ